MKTRTKTKLPYQYFKHIGLIASSCKLIDKKNISLKRYIFEVNNTEYVLETSISNVFFDCYVRANRAEKVTFE